jgi:transcriptional regulator with XRE-family HTH domain
MQTIGDRIKKMRLEKAWKQQDMARKLHISIPAYSNIETNLVDINISRLYEIANIFEVDVIFFIYSGKTDPQLNIVNEINDLKFKIGQYDNDITRLQEKLISLYEQADQIKRSGRILSDTN